MGNYLGFLNQTINLIKGSAAFRDRLGDFHAASNFADPNAVTEAEANQFIVGEDHGYFFALADKDGDARQRSYDLMPFAEIANESHTEINPGGSCGEEFTGLESSWSVMFLDKARDATATEIDVDPKASLLEFSQWLDEMIEQFKTANANQDYFFSTIAVSRPPRRSDPMKRNGEHDFWLAEITFTIDEDG